MFGTTQFGVVVFGGTLLLASFTVSFSGNAAFRNAKPAYIRPGDIHFVRCVGDILR